ncbi:MAG: ABC transporter permease [Ktedonobacteraceae bacterium]
MSMFPQSPGSESQPAASASLVESVVPSSGAQTEEKNAPAQWQRSSLGRSLHTLWRIFTLNRKATIGICLVLFFILVAIFGPLFIHTDPGALSNDVLIPPSATHWLGTTQTGQDIFSQLVIGTRVSILWGFATGLVVTALSVTVGLVAGYLGGIVDETLSLLINIFLVLPGFPLAVVLAAYLPLKGPLTVALVIALTSWAYQARVLRSQTLSMRHRDFVESASSIGEATWRIIFFEILPNEIAIVAAGFVSTAIYVILAAAGLEFLGLGDVTVIDWGTMFYWAQNNDALLLGAWWWYVAPGMCIALLGAGLALINFGIDEVANPRLRAETRLLRRVSRFSFSRSQKTQIAS